MTTNSISINDYQASFAHALATFDMTALHNIAALIDTRALSGGVVYVAGNGGSAANASHCAAHLVDAGIRAICLSDNIPLLTARANDYHYNASFAAAIPGRNLRSDDMVLVFSCSGSSRNVINLLHRARDSGASSAGMFGAIHGSPGDENWISYPLGPTLCDTSLTIDSKLYGVVEDLHSMAIHMLKEIIIAA